MNNPFFNNCGPFKVEDLLSKSNLPNTDNYKLDLIHDVKDLSSANDNDLTFFHSKKYSFLADKTNASYCVTSKSLNEY